VGRGRVTPDHTAATTAFAAVTSPPDSRNHTEESLLPTSDAS
jgi:hypothetical protein